MAEINRNDFIQKQMEMEASKFDSFFSKEHISRPIDLPDRYHATRIIAMVRDPWWIFAYWEITPEKESAVREEIARRGCVFASSVLRVYDVTGIKKFNGSNAHSYFDITLRDMARNWYIEVGQSNKSWCIDIGILSTTGEFFLLARSNIVKTPRFGISDILDRTWMCSEEDYWKVLGASSGYEPGKSSLEIKEFFRRRLQEWISSGGIGGSASFFIVRQR